MKTVIRTIADFVPAELAGTPAGDAIQRQTSKLRHEDRFAATRECAQEYVESLPACERWEPVLKSAAAALLLFADYVLPKRRRHPAFECLGTGYRRDLDGSAFMAASRDAIRASHWTLKISDAEPYTPHVLMVHKDTTSVVFTTAMVQSILGVQHAQEWAAEMLRVTYHNAYRLEVFSILDERPTLSTISAFYNSL